MDFFGGFDWVVMGWIASITAIFGYISGSLPLGRRTLHLETFIAAPPETVWRNMVSKDHVAELAPHLEAVEETADPDDPELYWGTYRIRGSNKEVQYAYRVKRSVPCEARCLEILNPDGSPVPESKRQTLAYYFVPEREGTRLKFVGEQPVSGLFNLLIAKTPQKNYLARLAALSEGREQNLRQVSLLLYVLVPSLIFMLGFSLIVGFHAISLVAAATIILAVIVHELGHVLAFKAFGHKDVSWFVIPFVGGRAQSLRHYQSRFEQGMVSLAGPGVSALYIPIGLAIVQKEGGGLDTVNFDALASIPGGWLYPFGAIFLLQVVILINCLNLLPIGCLDGAQIVRSIATSAMGRCVVGLTFVATPGFILLQILPAGMVLAILAFTCLEAGWGFSKGRLREADGLRAMTTGELTRLTACLTLVLALYAAGGLMGGGFFL